MALELIPNILFASPHPPQTSYYSYLTKLGQAY